MALAEGDSLSPPLPSPPLELASRSVRYNDAGNKRSVITNHDTITGWQVSETLFIKRQVLVDIQYGMHWIIQITLFWQPAASNIRLCQIGRASPTWRQLEAENQQIKRHLVFFFKCVYQTLISTLLLTNEQCGTHFFYSTELFSQFEVAPFWRTKER